MPKREETKSERRERKEHEHLARREEKKRLRQERKTREREARAAMMIDGVDDVKIENVANNDEEYNPDSDNDGAVSDDGLDIIKTANKTKMLSPSFIRGDGIVEDKFVVASDLVKYVGERAKRSAREDERGVR